MTAVARLVTPHQVSLEDACTAWLATFCGPEQRSTLTAYGKAADALIAAFGDEVSDVNGLDADDVAIWFTSRYASGAPATWNLRLNALRSAVEYWQRQRWLGHDPFVRIERRKPREDAGRAMPRTEIERLIGKRSASLRDRLLWSMLYETAARADEILSLDVEEIRQPDCSARVLGKGSRPRVVVWQTRTALLLAKYLKGRETGPLFLTGRKACVPVAACDLDPASGKARLTYRRAAEIFKAASGGKTLHQLRHSALTHDAESGTSTPMLMARSGHTSVRSLVRYARVSEDALKAHQQRTDPARRKAW